MRYFFSLFLILALFSNASFSQNKEVVITGKITDINNKALESATVKNLKTGYSFISDKNGRYLIKTRKEATILFSFLGYISVSKSLSLLSLKNKDTLLLDVVLEKETAQLKEVEITSQKGPEIVYGTPKLYVQDYEFYNNNLLLLIHEKNKQHLKLVNEKDSVLFDEPLTKEIKFLWKDCMDKVFLIGKDSLYKMELSSLHYYIEDRLPVGMFYSSLYPCVLSLSGNLYLQEYLRHNQGISYYKVNKSTKEEGLFKRIINWESMVNAQNTADSIRYLQAKIAFLYGTDSPEMAGEHDGLPFGYGVKIGRELFDEASSYKLIDNKAIYSPLKFIKDSIYIFNHEGDSVYVYNRIGESKRKYEIAYHKSQYWSKEIIVDQEHKQAFAKFNKNGQVFIKKLDLTNGSLSNEQILTYSTFPEKIKVKGDYIYYLYNERENEFSTKKLYKQKLDSGSRNQASGK